MLLDNAIINNGQCQICTQCRLCSIFGIGLLHIWHCMGAQLALCVFTICLVTHETIGLVWSLGRRFIWFGHSGDAWSGLVTWETLGLVWSLGWRLVWFGHSEDAWSGLAARVTLGLVWSLGWRLVWFGHSGGVRGCVMIIVKTLSGFNYSGDVVWFDPLRRRVVLVTSLRRRNQTLTWLSQSSQLSS